jgi:hypothetical protein
VATCFKVLFVGHSIDKKERNDFIGIQYESIKFGD